VVKILVIKPSSLGDVVHALPTVARIRAKFPDASISWLINGELSPLLADCPLIDDRIEFHRHQYAKLPSLLSRLRRARFDLVVDLQGLFRSGLMTWATGAPRRIGRSDAREGARFAYAEIVAVPDSQTPGTVSQRVGGPSPDTKHVPANIHAVDLCLLIADYLKCPPRPVSFPLGRDDAAVRAVDALLTAVPPAGLIAVNPSARWRTKLWGDENFRALLMRLPRERIVLTGSRHDAVPIAAVAGGCLNLAGKTGLLELVELLRRCSVLVTGDSGPMHLAAAVGTPVVAIFGSTDPVLTGPYGSGHVVLRADVPCSPCLSTTCRNPVAMECMRRVTVEQVRAALEPVVKQAVSSDAVGRHGRQVASVAESSAICTPTNYPSAVLLNPPSVGDRRTRNLASK
jgi:heptosyltransferase I